MATASTVHVQICPLSPDDYAVFKWLTAFSGIRQSDFEPMLQDAIQQAMEWNRHKSRQHVLASIEEEPDYWKGEVACQFEGGLQAAFSKHIEESITQFKGYKKALHYIDHSDVHLIETQLECEFWRCTHEQKNRPEYRWPVAWFLANIVRSIHWFAVSVAVLNHLGKWNNESLLPPENLPVKQAKPKRKARKTA